MNFLIYTNILTPYRKYFYDLINEECQRTGDQFHVLVMAETESNRTWKFEDLRSEYTILLESITISWGETYFHFNRNLPKMLMSLSPEIVVCAGGYNCPGVWEIVSLKNKLNYRCYFWSESHLNEVKNNNQIKLLIRELLRKWIYQKFDGFWYAGKLSREFCEKYAASAAKYFFLPNVVDENKYSQRMSDEQRQCLRKKYRLSQNSVVFICPARLSPVKGILEFLEMIKESANSKRAVFLIAGSGELREKIIERSEEYRLDVRLLGEKSQEEIMQLYAISDAFLMPSLSDPNPLTCIEALWEGLPLFISDHCGNSYEVIRQGINGYVFSYENLENALEMFDKIVTADLEWREIASKTSVEIAEQIYNSKNTVKRIISEMRRTI
ncbi:glycosyltransferase family 4 protein [[Ruminococcus] torques]|uniref:glycosyltransferase family 4 protein n=1 Tax=[Ruminococcus] torques TaxID=33039 RepID=UPI0025A4C64D|nr:glycosyltransferase family 4 protein [[Ruminococcus] torques]MDM8236974.1 glycosyltransferase family 4 protein [[Ruminococcus] torques]